MNKILIIGLLVCFFSIKIQAQESVNAAGNNAVGAGGSVSYSIGQVTYSYENGTNGNSSQGVQQPYEIYTIGLENLHSNIELIVFPNPTTNILNLQFEDYLNFSPVLILMDINGKILLENQITSNTTLVDLSEKPSGIYVLNIISAENSIKTFKIIKK